MYKGKGKREKEKGFSHFPFPAPNKHRKWEMSFPTSAFPYFRPQTKYANNWRVCLLWNLKCLSTKINIEIRLVWTKIKFEIRLVKNAYDVVSLALTGGHGKARGATNPMKYRKKKRKEYIKKPYKVRSMVLLLHIATPFKEGLVQEHFL